MSASVKFCLRGDSLNARYAPGGATPGNIAGVTQVNASGIGIIGAGYLDLSASLAARGLVFPGPGNFPTSNKFSVLIRCCFINSFSPDMGLWALGFPQQLGTAGIVQQAGTVFQDVESLTAVSDIGANQGNIATTLGQYFDIVALYDMTTTADGSLQLFVDGVQIGSNNNTSTWGSSRALVGYVLGIGAASPYIGQTRIRVNEFVVWDGVIDPTNIQLDSGIGSLNGQTRTSFVTAAALDGSIFTDPGVANVLAPVAYEFAGVPLTGTASSSVDPGIANVKKGIQYDINGAPLVGTYDLNAVISSSDSAVDAAVDGLANYLKGISGLNVETEWPDSNEQLQMPSVTLTAGKDKRTPIQPEEVSRTLPDDNNQVVQVVATAHYDLSIQLDLWCRTKAERRQFLNAILGAFNASENNSDAPSGLSLQLTNYFNVYARYEIDAHEFRDDEVAAERQERRATIMLLVNTRECVSRTMYAINQTTVLQQTDSANSPLTDDAQHTESKNYP